MESNNCMSVLSCVGTNVASAFVASLERCYCIHLNTIDFDDNDDDLHPLFLSYGTTGAHQDQDESTTDPDQPIKKSTDTHRHVNDVVSA